MPAHSSMEVFTGLFQHFWLKATGAFVAYTGYQFFVSDPEHVRAVTGLVYIVMLDTVLGVTVALTRRNLSSWKMGQPLAKKVCLYFFAILATVILHNSSSGFEWAPTYMTLFFILSELLSVFEKLSLLGLTLPTRLVARINSIFQDMLEGKSGARESIEKKQ